jgi:hypothetical protein
MSDIYEQKAKKYKYKYLKLKKEYIGVGGVYPQVYGQAQYPQYGQQQYRQQQYGHPQYGQQQRFPQQTQAYGQPQQQVYRPQPIQQDQIQKDFISFNKKTKIKYIGFGSFGCLISPPLLFNEIIKKDHPNHVIDIKAIESNDNYIGKLLIYDNDGYIKELKEFKKIITYDPEIKYTPKLIFAGYMDKTKLVPFIRNLRDNNNNNNNNDQLQLYTCLLQKFEKNPNKHYGYIISTKVGKSFDKITSNEFKRSSIKTILTSLRNGIDTFINNLYIKGMVHGDIKMGNMTLNDNKVYFIDFGFIHAHNDNDKTSMLLSRNISNYPIILFMFLNVILIMFQPPHYYTYNTQVYKHNLINLLKSLYEQLYKTVNTEDLTHLVIYNNKMFKNNKFDSNSTFIDSFFKNLDDNKLYSLQYIYEKCLIPVAKNIDIYALSLFIHELFYGILYHKYIKFQLANKFVEQHTNILVKQLFEDALYNKIAGPKDLSARLTDIIYSIDDIVYM